MPSTRTPDDAQANVNLEASDKPNGGLHSSFATVVAGMGIRAALQAVLTILLARLLGRMDYGACVVIGSVAAFFSVWAGFGAAALHLRDAAIAPHMWQDSFVVRHISLWKTQAPLLVLALLAAWLIAGSEASFLALLLLIVGDLLGIPAADLLVRSYQGRERYAEMALAMCVLPLTRVVFLIFFAITHGSLDLVAWSFINFLTGAAMAVLVAVMAAKAERGATNASQQYSKEYCSGLSFSLAAASSRIHADADKAIIAKLSSFGIAGEYSLAYRMMDVLLLPINGMIEWSMRALFQHGKGGLVASLAALWRRWLVLLGLALLACAFAYLLSPVLPIIFGEEFAEAVIIGRWLSLLPFTTAIWMIVRSIMTTTENQKFIGLVELMGAGLSVAFGVLLVTHYGWRGAVLATYGTHIAMTLIVVGAVVRQFDSLTQKSG